MKRTLYGVKNAPKAFWLLLPGIMNGLGYQWNHADPCLYCKWDKTFGLIVWLSFIDVMLIVCAEDAMESIKKKFMKTVDCNYIGEMNEYILAQKSTLISTTKHYKLCNLF